MTYDFDGIVTALKEKLSLLSDWRTTLYYGVYQRIIDATAYIIDKFVYLAEFLYRESNWTTALKKRSLMLKAEYLGYTAHRRQAPSGQLLMTGDSTGFYSNYTYPRETVIVPRWNQFSNSDGDVIVFCTEETTYTKNTAIVKRLLTATSVTDEGGGTVGLPISNTASIVAGDVIKVVGTENYNGYHTVTSIIANTSIVITTTYTAETLDGTEYVVDGITFVPVKQGTPKSYTYTATGSTSEVITLYSDSIDNDEIEVFIVDADGATISTVSICGVDTTTEKLYFLNDPNNYYCEVYNDYDFEAVYIKFGDDIHSKKLTAGSYVLIKYAETDGEEGNITNSGTITTVVTELEDANGDEPTLYFTNDEAISDGTDIEDIESIRNNAPNLFSTGYRCGSYYDWVNILENHSDIHKAIVWTTDDEADDTVTQYQNKVYVSAISTDGSELTESQKNDITINYLKEKKSPTEVVSWQTLNVIYALFKVTATIKNVNKATVKEEVFDAMDAEYGILNTDFGTDIYESNFSNIIDDIDNIYYHTTEMYNMEVLSNTTIANQAIAVYNSSTTATDVIKLVANTLEIWVQLKSGTTWGTPARVAYDSDGTWVAETGYTITNGNITYTSSQFSFIIGGLTGTIDTDYRLFLCYKTQDDNGDRQNDVRLPAFNYITDVLEDFVLITNASGTSTLTYKSTT